MINNEMINNNELDKYIESQIIVRGLNEDITSVIQWRQVCKRWKEICDQFLLVWYEKTLYLEEKAYKEFEMNWFGMHESYKYPIQECYEYYNKEARFFFDEDHSQPYPDSKCCLEYTKLYSARWQQVDYHIHNRGGDYWLSNLIPNGLVIEIDLLRSKPGQYRFRIHVKDTEGERTYYDEQDRLQFIDCKVFYGNIINTVCSLNYWWRIDREYLESKVAKFDKRKDKYFNKYQEKSWFCEWKIRQWVVDILII